MIIYSGFWAGFISGALVGIVTLVFVSMIVNYKQSSVNKKILDFMKNSLSEKEKEEILKGVFDEGNN